MIFDLGPVRGSDGTDGENGADGLNGISVDVEVIANTDNEYILRFTSVDGVFETPNLRGTNAIESGMVPIKLVDAEQQDVGFSPYYIRLNADGAALVQAIMILGVLEYITVKQLSTEPYALPEITGVSANYYEGSTTITWEAASNYVHHYEIEGASGVTIIDGDETSFITDLTEGAQVTFAVVDIAGNTASQQVTVAGVPPAPVIQALTAKKLYTESLVPVTWIVTSAYIDHFEITYGGQTYNIAADQNSYTANIPNGSLILFRAIDTFGQIATANTEAVYLPQLPVITKFSAKNPNTGTAVLQWAYTGAYVDHIEIDWFDQHVSLSAGSTSYSAAIAVGVNVTLTLVDMYGQRVLSTIPVLAITPMMDPSNQNIALKFGMTTNTAAEVTAVWRAVEEYLDINDLENFNKGDYIRLASLHVANATRKGTYSGAGDVTFTGAAVVDDAFYIGTRLQITLVEKDPYVGKNGNTKHHLAFQFLNLPLGNLRSQMNNNNVTAGGYAACALRQWIINEWRSALIIAGIPEDMLFAPKRLLYNSTSPAAILEDDVYLPTEWEMQGSRTYALPAENDGTQVHLAYYKDNDSRKKYYSSGSSQVYYYWCSSVYSSNNFCCVNSDGNASHNVAYNTNSVAPCFCAA
jgi:hypothetical protein